MSIILFIGNFPSFLSFVEASMYTRFMSFVDRKIERLGHCLRSWFGRREHPVEKTTTALIANNMESPETSDTTPLPINDVELHENKVQLQGSSSANKEIETKQVMLLILIRLSLFFDRQDYQLIDL